MKEKNENSYRSILKGTSVLGGVQVFQILVNLIRGKLVAMFLGPEGMGIASLFTTSSNTLSNFSSLGLNLAFVKEVAANKEDETSLAKVLSVATALLRLTALLGAMACVLLAPMFSQWSFGSADYAWQYVLLSVGVFFTVAGMGKMSLLQGLHRVKLLSLTSLAGALSGLLVGVPLYYFFNTKGIVPAMIVFSFTTYCFYSYGVRKAMPASRVKFSFKEHGGYVKRMLSLGVILLASSLINTLFTYLINIFIRSCGDVVDVGLFNAANSITLQYAGVVFAAMALDYFPRLSAAAEDSEKMSGIVNKQSEMVALIATPMLVLLVAMAPIVIHLLLTPEFLVVTDLMRWLAIGILFKAIAYPLGYIAFAKNNRKVFFWLEAIACNVIYISFSIIGYKLWGLQGLGYAAVAEQATCVILYLAVNYKVYGFHPNEKAFRESLMAIIFGTLSFGASMVGNMYLSYSLLLLVFALCGVRSFVILKARVKDNR